MKHLLIFFLFSGSLSAFSQVKATTLPGQWNIFQAELRATMNAICYHNTLTCRCSSGEVILKDTAPHRLDLKAQGWIVQPAAPDTLPAICLVTMCKTCVAVPRMGYVVISEGKRPVYLDCRKRALKLPMVGWDFREVGGTEK